MAWFKQGATYRFTMGSAKDKKIAASRTQRLSFVRVEPGAGVTHHLFKLVPGGALESFTEVQLGDYQIEKVA